ncbi:YeiH family protein [Blastochloris sulfoviridis]|uniref:Putative sulfate exporter family transporter n=1 Tax=Blastochloris sulfoviridis TaxID=50712 RepID=A0A5M6I3K5_9HYPH|nr:putative sulfate exporter family transporter [Blastochloris sulfoviridis]KAA5602429.1 putative sulfate exporter family transporter [Blastochloris sulfoviridis]
MSLDKPAAGEEAATGPLGSAVALAPGLVVCAGLAYASVQIEPYGTKAMLALVGAPITITAPVIALLIGMALHPLVARPAFMPGMNFAIKKLLRWAIALFGLKIALSDIIGLGAGTAAMVIVSMAATLVAGVVLARLLGRSDSYGAIAGGATAVCGASAALATASVLPHYKGRESDMAFVAVTVNILATLAMVFYPPICAGLGFDERTTGILLGATIHDVAQVVGAGYAVSDTAGNVATVVKLFRVFMLLPVVLLVGWWFASEGGDVHKAKVPVPMFAIMFLVFVAINSVGILPVEIKSALVEASRWGLLIAIAALGFNTSLATILRIGPQHLLVVLGATLVVFTLPLGWLMILG